jgi:type I restriction enzyme S subunit
MQELLTGRRRLPGFSGEWETKSMGDIAEIVGGGTPKTNNPRFWNGNINWFTPTEIGINKYSYISERRITREGLLSSSAKLLPIGTILLTSRAGIGDASILMSEGCTNQGFQSLVPKEGFYNEFLYYRVLTLKDILIQNASGSTFLEISPNRLKQIEILYPQINEQLAIANFLSDMDSEIKALEDQLSKYRLLKQAMMQELLTGRIRLI